MPATDFTPGPWVVDKTKAIGAYGVWSDRTYPIGDEGGMYPIQVCAVYGSDIAPPRVISKEQRDANARLIAAAPEMYEALRRVTAEMLPRTVIDIEIIQQAVDAIAKAS